MSFAAGSVAVAREELAKARASESLYSIFHQYANSFTMFG
jgi:hypothetical protein